MPTMLLSSRDVLQVDSFHPGAVELALGAFGFGHNFRLMHCGRH